MLVHLEPEEFARLLCGEEDIVASGHLEICPECQQKLESWQDSLRQLRDNVAFSSQRPGAFWDTQRASILKKLEALPSLRSAWNVGWTLACSALAFAVLLLVFVDFQQTRNVIHTPSSEISDAALLGDIEEHLSEEVPEALQPANLLVSEMSTAQNKHLQAVHNTSVRKLK